jgi:hypothetical protein
MSDQSLAHAPSAGMLGRITPLVKIAVLTVTVIGAVPTVLTAYNAWQYKIPFSEVSHRLGQYDILARNIGCTIDYKAIATSDGMKVDVGACPATRDISLKVSTPGGASSYEWIAYSQLRKPGEAPPSGIMNLLFGVAHAADAPQSTPLRMAQAGMEVKCQSLISKLELVRVVKEAGKCYRETISPVRGSVDERKEVPCDIQCPSAS